MSEKEKLLQNPLVKEIASEYKSYCSPYDKEAEWITYVTEQTKKQPLFTTEDGQYAYKGDDVIAVNIANDNCSIYATIKAETSNQDKRFWKYFIRVDNAKDYVEKNRPKYSEQQILDACDASNQVYNHNVQVNTLKQKLGIK